MPKLPTKANIVRKKLQRISKEEAIQAILISQQEIKEGKIFRGDLRDYLKKI